MKINLRASTNVGYMPKKEEFDNFGGHAAGVCYMKNDFETILQEDALKTQKRIMQTKLGGHHSVYDHAKMTLELIDIPKALAMVLNNEKDFSTSEKSARYTKMVLKEDEQKLYDKWLNIYKDLIKEAYGEKYPDLFNESKIEKLAQENARYLISVFTPTSMLYTCSYRQLNYLYGFFQKEINKENTNEFYKTLKPAMIDFCEAIKSTGFVDDYLIDNGKNREFSLIRPATKPIQPYYGDVYATEYKGSFAQLAQAQRHRTIDYSMTLLDSPEFYFPPIIRKSEQLKKQWLEDCEKQSSCFPQGMLVNISEMGTYDNFILKMKERKCTFAQLEINQQTDATLNSYITGLSQNNHPLANELKQYAKGSRCTFPDYKCGAACRFPEGINGTREI